MGNKVYLTKANKIWWTLRSEDGRELAPPTMFGLQVEAEEWARAWVSSWIGWELIVDVKEDRVSK